MLPQHIHTRQHTHMLRSISLRIPSRHTVTAAESASGLDTVTTVVTVGTLAAIAATTVVTVGTMEEITADTTVAMVDIPEVMAATTADTVAITESMNLDRTFPLTRLGKYHLPSFFATDHCGIGCNSSGGLEVEDRSLPDAYQEK